MRKFLILFAFAIISVFVMSTPTVTQAVEYEDYEGICEIAGTIEYCFCYKGGWETNDSCFADPPLKNCSCRRQISSEPEEPGPPPDVPTNGCGSGGINTALGCIPVKDTTAFAGWILRWGMGIGGGVAMIMIAYSSFLIMTSAGDPGKLQAGKELLTASISGILFLLFGAYLLQLIGVDILGIPNFGT